MRTSPEIAYGYRIANVIASLAFCHHNYAEKLFKQGGRNYTISSVELRYFVSAAEEALDIAKGLELKATHKKAMILRAYGMLGVCNAKEAIEAINDTKHTMIEELKTACLYFIPEKRLSYLYITEPFGNTTLLAFPDASYDIEEASNCFALGRFTACVYHCMRVLEHGLCALAYKFKVPYAHKTWNGVILPIEKAIRDIKAAPKKTRNWKRDEQFYSEAAVQFMFFKDAWRNFTAHKQFTYDEEKAEAIFRHVRDFMLHLSQRLKQAKKIS